MKKSTRRRPELESLETLMLLSNVLAEAHHAAGSTARVAAPVTLNLAGSTEALLTKSNLHFIQEDAHHTIAAKFSSKGHLARLGPVTVTAVETLKSGPGNSLTYSTTDTVSTGRGDLFLVGYAVGPGGQAGTSGNSVGLTYDYTITGGTKDYAGASGFGSIIETTALGTAGSLSKKSLRFVAQQLPPSTQYGIPQPSMISVSDPTPVAGA